MKHETNKSEREDFEYWCSSCERLWQVGYPTILAAGIVGNALSVLAFAVHKLRRETRLLCSLCAALDSLALVAAFMSRWPDAALGITIMHPALCHVLTTANYWLPELAAWTLVYLSINRFLSGNTCETFFILLALIFKLIQSKHHRRRVIRPREARAPSVLNLFLNQAILKSLLLTIGAQRFLSTYYECPSVFYTTRRQWWTKLVNLTLYFIY